MTEVVASHPVDSVINDVRRRANGCAQIVVIIMTLMSIFLYTSTLMVQDSVEVMDMMPHGESVMPLMPPAMTQFTDVNTPSSKVQVYLHTSQTLPKTNFQLENHSKTVNIEASRLLNIDHDTTLRWTHDAGKALNLFPSKNIYGLTSLYISSINELQKIRAIMRMPKELCRHSETSWTCQADSNYQHFDNSYCVVILESFVLEEITSFAKKAAETGKPDINAPIVKGTFCGNPLLQRVAAGSHTVYILNKKHDKGNPEEDYLLCKFNAETAELSLCVDIAKSNPNYTKPLALIYDAATDSVVTIQYMKDSNLSVVVFGGQTLNLKPLFKTFSSPGGFLMHSEDYAGGLIFHGDVSCYEVDTVINLASGQDITIKPI